MTRRLTPRCLTVLPVGRVIQSKRALTIRLTHRTSGHRSSGACPTSAPVSKSHRVFGERRHNKRSDCRSVRAPLRFDPRRPCVSIGHSCQFVHTGWHPPLSHQAVPRTSPLFTTALAVGTGRCSSRGGFHGRAEARPAHDALSHAHAIDDRPSPSDVSEQRRHAYNTERSHECVGRVPPFTFRSRPTTAPLPYHALTRAHNSTENGEVAP